MTLVRSAGLRGFRSVVAELGGDADELARRAGVPEGALDTDDLFITDVSIAVALELAAGELECPDLGLRVAQRQDIGLIGPLWLAVQNSATVGEAFECASSYLFVHAPALRIQRVPDPYGTRGVVAVDYDAGPGRRLAVQGTGLVLGFLHRAARTLVGGDYGLRGVEVPHPVADEAAYEAFFSAPVRTERPRALLRVPAELVNRPLPHSDDAVRHLALSLLAHSPSQAGDDVVGSVRSALIASMGQSLPSQAQVARMLGMHSRTLQRRLLAADSSFAEVLDEARRQTVRRLLTTTDLTMSQISTYVGFAEQATLSRRSRAWWGLTPSQVRRGDAG